jgi:hypothetical protein
VGYLARFGLGFELKAVESRLVSIMGGLSGCGLSSRRNFDCAPEGANFLQTGRAGLWPIGFRRMGRFSGRPLRGGVGAIPGLGIETWGTQRPSKDPFPDLGTLWNRSRIFLRYSLFILR